MPHDPKSPAVIAFENEKARAVRGEKNQVQEGLEGTFPASDPLSISSTVTRQGSTAAEPIAGSRAPAPLVDQALETVRLRETDTSFGEDEIAAFKDELLSLQGRAENAGIELKGEVVGRFNDRLDAIRDLIRHKPWQSLAIAGVIGFLLGISR